jgi:hypothetical protein
MSELTQEAVDTEYDALEEILKEDFYCLTAIGDTADGFETVAREEGEDRRWNRLVTLTTKTPLGLFYQWQYDEALTEYQDTAPPEGISRQVEPFEEVIVKTSYKEIPWTKLGAETVSAK